MTIREKNLQALKEQQPFLVEKLEQHKYDEKPSDVLFQEYEAKDGNRIFSVTKEGQEKFLNSRYKPIQEAQKYASQFAKIKDYAVYAFFGFGNGLFAREIEKQGSDLVRYAFYEPSMESFLYVIDHYDISDIVGSDKVTIYVDGINELELAAYLPDMVEWPNLPLLEIFCLPQYEHLFPEEYCNFVKVIRDISARVQMGMNTIVAYAERRTSNIIYHLRHIFNCNSANDFINKFPTHMPAILVSAGPSLAKNIEYLKKVKNHVFILAVDTAVKKLFEADITPDAVMGVDPIKWRAYIQREMYRYKDILWITKLDGNVSVTNVVFAKRNVFISAEDGYIDVLANEYGHEFPELATGGSVANSAFSLLELWGFETIIMVGQDLALTGGKRFGDERDHENAYQEAIDKGFSLIEVDGYNGDTVITREDYFTYLKWFEGAISISKVPNIINATEGGAKIHGAIQMPLKEALEQYAKEEYPLEEIINQVPRLFNEEEKISLLNELEKAPEEFEKLQKKFEEGYELAFAAKKLVEKPNYNVVEVEKIKLKLDKIAEQVSNSKEYILINMRACEVERKLARKRIVSAEEDLNDSLSILEGLCDLYQEFSKAAKEIAGLFRNILYYIPKEKMQMRKILFLIPARSQSKSVPHKNIREIAGKPMLAYSIEHAFKAGWATRIIVSTDSEEYAEIARKYEAEVPFIRPAEYAKDDSTDYEVFRHALDYLKEKEDYVPELVVQLRPTYPIRDPEDIKHMIEIMLEHEEADSIRTIAPAKEIPYKMWLKGENGQIKPLIDDMPECYNMPRQQLPKVYYQNACIDIFRPRAIYDYHSMTGKVVLGYEMKQNYDIDTEEEFARASQYLEIKNGGKQFVFDIDGVIAQFSKELDYAHVEPRTEMVKVIQKLHEYGNTIVLFTARGYVTGQDWEAVTKEQMKKWNVPYDELIFGKPNADYYVDDKMMDMDALVNLILKEDKE